MTKAEAGDLILDVKALNVKVVFDKDDSKPMEQLYKQKAPGKLNVWNTVFINEHINGENPAKRDKVF